MQQKIMQVSHFSPCCTAVNGSARVMSVQDHSCVICSAVNQRYDLFVDGDLNTAVAGLTALVV